MASQILGDFYQVEQQLAKKAGRKTLLCRDLRSQDLVVVKLVSFSSDFEWDDLKLFEREAETLKSLSHSAIPQYLDYFEVESDRSKSFALVQTYIPAKSLQAYLHTGRTFSEAEVQELAKALLEILIYLHDRHPAVIHRDIKPSNVLLSDRSGNSIGQVYLVDFGSVQTLAAKEDGTITVVGTYGYMPPEQFGGRTVPASDIYSLGATLIGLLTGTHPADLPQKDGCIQFAALVNVSRNFASWLERTIQPSLDKRFTSARKALQVLENPPQLQLQVAGKPLGSKVVLKKDIDSLEIIIPAKGFNLGIVMTIGFAIAWNSFILFWTFGMLLVPLPANLLFLLFALPFWLVGFSMVKEILWSLFGQVHLSLNRQQISLIYNLLGFKYSRLHPARTADITKLEYVKKDFKYNSESVLVAIKPRIIIWVGTYKYELGNSSNSDQSGLDSILTKPELEWLVNELSDWLGIPIIKES
ncbi:serine/threonine protein kinase [Aliterella atlantica]|uniref:Serine/threonine protein kinase n=1 Tax=Aliterella atlantica CENA595 TaxID=1618023 RepID=A0A0D8ZMQ7_9CYAN|nr:serine/threonine-protein kinase [Aliterella atlantica]KJH69719.1 serine/threonine protein kinase [Aliterella atlantica CENA595]